MQASDSILREIVALLLSSLRIYPPPGLVDNDRAPGKSNLGLGIATAPPGTSLMSSHVDDGLLTLLYHITPFVEIRSDPGMPWSNVEMIEGCHIVNVGSALQELSSGKLRAAEHRIVQAQGDNHLVTYYLHANSGGAV